MGGNFGISSLEEDFRDLGLVEPSSGTEGASNGESGEITEKFRLAFRGKKAVRTKLHRQTGSERAAGRRHARMGSVKAARKKSLRKKMRSSKFRRMQAFKRRISHKMHGESVRTLKARTMQLIGEARAFMRARHPKTVAEAVQYFVRARVNYGAASHLAEELEELHRITSQVAAYEAKDVVQSFANIALIADKLKARFEMLASALKRYALDEEMHAVAEVYAQLSEDAAKLAKGLNESDGTQFDFAALSEAFRSQMRLLLQGIDIYGGLVEGSDEEDADEDGDDDDEDAEDEDGDDEDDDDEDDDDGEDDEEGED